MADIRIDSLPVANFQQPTDMFAFQRNVAGVWTDFHTTFNAFGGDVQVVFLQWDLATPLTPTALVTPSSGDLVIFLNATWKYTADVTPVTGNCQANLSQGSTLVAQLEIQTDANSGAQNSIDLQECKELDQPLVVEQAGAVVNGTVELMVQYLIIRA